MGKPSAPRAPDPYQTAGADFAYNNISQYTPYGNMEYAAPQFQNVGSNRHPFMQQTRGGTATLTLDPRIQQLLDSQIGVSQGMLSEALRRLPELSKMGPVPEFSRDEYEQQLFQRQRGLLDPVFADQERAMRDRLANQGLPVTSEAYGYDSNQFQDNRNQAYSNAAMDATFRAGDLMSQDIANFGAGRALQFNEIASLLGLQQVQPPGMNSFYGPRGADFTGAQALQSGMQQQNYQQQMGLYGDIMGGLFNLGSAGIGLSDRRLKKNIHRIGTHPLGIGIYEFDYIWGDHAVGVMADEVMEVMPEAVVDINGYKAVNYGML